ncbi:MAG: bifunctional serine/threonine-protein kinase/formylglycine-generating enzyme family protein [bacterium]
MSEKDFDQETMRRAGPVSMGDVKTSGREGAPLGCIDQYELLRELGGGGFGTVYLARDTVAGIEVAVKGLPPLVRNNAEELERIRENFALVSKLHHPHIAAALHLHQAKETRYADERVRQALRVLPGYYLMVMAYAPGVTLSKWRKQFSEGKVPVAQALEVCRQVAEALDYAHGMRVAHRDVKPSNVMVETRETEVRRQKSEDRTGSGDGRGTGLSVQMLDFGLAAEIRSSMSRVSQEKGDTSGTRPYMAPEQWVGKKQDGRADQYALGALFYELVSGAVPFASAFDTGDAVIMANAAENKKPDSLGVLTKAQNAALLRGLAKEPGERFADCSAFVAALAGDRSQKPGVRSQKKAWALGLAAVAAVALAYGTYRTYGEYRRQETEARSRNEQAARLFAAQREKADAERQAAARLAKERADAAALASAAKVRNSGPAEGEPWASPSTGMEFVWVASLKLWVGKYEVTNGEYRKEEPGHDSKEYQGQSLNGERQPVVLVNFDDAAAYAAWLTERDQAQLGGMWYRVPSEAEWRAAAQCGDGRKYPWGDAMPPKYGNYSDSASPISGKIDGYTDGYAVACPVEKSGKNDWGLYGMGGNVWEGCASDASGSSFGAWRGASWSDDDPDALRCACRIYVGGSGRDDYGGFRLVLSR